ncbi:MAG TPA: hypothetical protein VHE61_09490, partial [Opitutaceae bacterium]|nr:hypothetical protein [Opitutaceae bacterium]
MNHAAEELAPGPIVSLRSAAATASRGDPRPAGVANAAPPERRRGLHVAIALAGTDRGRSGIGTYVREVLPA